MRANPFNKEKFLKKNMKESFKVMLIYAFFTGVLISSNCSQIRFLLERHKENVTTVCSRVFNNRSVMLTL